MKDTFNLTICIFVKRGLKVCTLNTENIHPIIDIIGLDLFVSNKSICRFFLTYRPPNASPIYDSISSDFYLINMITFMTNNMNSKGPTIILGDMNCPNINWKINKALCSGAETQLADFVNSNGMIQYVDQPTHDSHTLDVLLLNDPLILTSLSVIDPFSTSDHCTVVFSLCVAIHDTIDHRIFYDWLQADWTGFNDFILQVDWLYILTENLTVDTLWTAFSRILNAGMESFVPCRVKNSTLLNSKKKYPKRIRQLLSNKGRTFRAMKANPNNNNLVERYKQLTVDFRGAVRTYEMEEENKVINSNSIGTFYKYVNRRMSHPTGIGVLYDNNTPVVEDDKKADLLNSYFESVYVDDDGRLPICDTRVSSDVKLDDVTFSPEIIYATIRRLKPTTVCDPEGYPPILIKRLITSLTYPLSLIFNSFMSIGKIPSSWKNAIITPIYKKGLASDPNNYRPVSLTSVFGKLMERIIVKELLTYLERHNLISKSQHGFLRRLSTCTNLIECMNDWTIMLEEGSRVAVAYIDYSRAFDSVTHAKLIHKLRSYGILGGLLDFIAFYLNNRAHRTRVGSCLSSSANIRSGVVQGSCLGPILFVLFINDIVDKLNSSTTAKLYADDIKLYASITVDSDFNNLQHSLDILYLWSSEWQLYISYQKCCIVIIDANFRRVLGYDNFSFKLDTHILECKPATRDLGVIVDNRLTFSNHIAEITKKAHQRANLIFRCFSSKDVDTLLRAFTTYVRPLLEYNSQIWSPITINDIFKIEQVQKHFTKRLNGFSSFTYFQRLQLLKLDSLELRRLRSDLIFLYKILFDKIGIDSKSFVSVQNRQSMQLRSHRYQIIPLHRFHAARSDRCLFSRTTCIWNSLPADTDFGSIHRFVKSLPNSFLVKYCKLNFS